jgi:menaquinone-dependent protoporphyrinogen oxidase
VKVLVAYASKRGSTAEIARAIAETLRQSGLTVDCIAAGKVKSLDPYDAVVLGSAVYIKRWRGDAKRFLRRHGKELARRPFWVFSSSQVGNPDEDDTPPDWKEPPSIVATVERLGARGHVVFGGRLPTEPRWPVHRAMVEKIPPEYRDLRDWDDIRAWATQVAGELGAATGRALGRPAP